MTDSTKRLAQIATSDVDVRQVIDEFNQVERIYREALEAMGQGREDNPVVRNSADITLFFRASVNSSTAS
jgi:hypothetical protein